MRSWPWESLLAVARHKDTAEMCSTDIAEREREFWEDWQPKLLSCCFTLHQRGNRPVDERT